MCYEYDTYYFRARALEALRRKTKVSDEVARPVEPKPSARPQEPQAPVAKPETAPA
jgi:hypothetical protein